MNRRESRGGTSEKMWNNGELNGHLMEITGHIFSQSDEKTGKRVIDAKGTCHAEWEKN